LRKDECQLPQFLRKSMRGNGEVKRAKGAGRKDRLRFLYPVVKDFFELMRVHGKYIDPWDLEEYLQHTLQRYLMRPRSLRSLLPLRRAADLRSALSS
jgi:hypothetical protein